MSGNRILTMVAGVLGGSAVLIGAFGAHGLPAALERQGLDAAEIAGRAAWLETGARYHLAHAVAVLALSIGGPAPIARWRSWASGAFVGGILLFSGSLYLLSITGVRSLGAITPVGGILLIVGWLIVVAGALGDGIDNRQN